MVKKVTKIDLLIQLAEEYPDIFTYTSQTCQLDMKHCPWNLATVRNGLFRIFDFMQNTIQDFHTGSDGDKVVLSYNSLIPYYTRDINEARAVIIASMEYYYKLCNEAKEYFYKQKVERILNKLS